MIIINETCVSRGSKLEVHLHETTIRNSSGDEIANVNFLTDGIVGLHAIQ